MKTIKQIADEIGVSKQAVHKKMKKEPLLTSLRGLTSIKGNTVYISVDGEKLIKSGFSSHIELKSSTVDDNRGDEVCDLVDTLKKELDIKNNQIESQMDFYKSEIEIKNKQITDLSSALVSSQKSLESAHALHAGTIQQNILTSESSEESISDKFSNETTIKKKGFFSFLRKK